jgi:dTDP-4-amino-4,6-dideoxygalactose transaminase
VTSVAGNKVSLAELGVITGRPAFAAPLHVGAPPRVEVDGFVRRARDILDRRWLTNDGPYVKELERRVAEETGVEHCVAMCSGTTALELALRAAELKGEVIVPAFTFVATAHTLLWQGLTPVFCEIDQRTHNINAARLEGLINERTSAIIGVHVWGRPAYSDDLARLAERYGLRLFFDAAHAFGCSYEGNPVGGRGDAEILSFHATKVVSTFEGGAVLTNDDDLDARIRLLRNFGFVDYDDVRALGTNGKLPEVSAAMGLASLDRLDEIVAANKRNYSRYRVELDSVTGVSLLDYDEAERSNFHYVVLELDPDECRLDRDDLVRVLHAENVIARRYFYPGVHKMEPYRSLYPGLSLPATEAVADRVVVLPTGESVDESDIATIAGVIRLAVENADSLPKPLPPYRRVASPPVTVA